ncbi:MAG: AraC family ligand binding domain-containing protein, partial [Planctomycetes bacterium]|nr:AraC family ligand binding domain-containing protein [Planctomycetota bacterium]
FRDWGIRFAGLSELVEGYDNGNPEGIFHTLFIGTLGGRGRLLTPSLHLDLLPGSLLVFPPDTPVRFAADGNWEILWFYTSANGVWQSPDEALLRPCACLPALKIFMESYLEDADGGEGTLPAAHAAALLAMTRLRAASGLGSDISARKRELNL